MGFRGARGSGVVDHRCFEECLRVVLNSMNTVCKGILRWGLGGLGVAG